MSPARIDGPGDTATGFRRRFLAFRDESVPAGGPPEYALGGRGLRGLCRVLASLCAVYAVGVLAGLVHAAALPAAGLTTGFAPMLLVASSGALAVTGTLLARANAAYGAWVQRVEHAVPSARRAGVGAMAWLAVVTAAGGAQAVAGVRLATPIPDVSAWGTEAFLVAYAILVPTRAFAVASLSFPAGFVALVVLLGVFLPLFVAAGTVLAVTLQRERALTALRTSPPVLRVK